jgi:hypothetical protein
MKAYKFEVVCFDPNGDCDFDSMLYEIKNIKYSGFANKSFLQNLLNVVNGMTTTH